MKFSKLNKRNIVEAKQAVMAATYETRIVSEGKVEATDTVTKPKV